MLAITRQDIINDDLGALSAAPRRLGRGAATKLNDIFWTEFLGGEVAGFWSATHTDVGNTGNSNLNSGAADATIAGLTATELLFLNQVDPQGLPLGVMPKIVLVPNALKAAMSALLHPQSMMITGASATVSNVNVFAGRFQLESSSYLANANYTGYSAIEWYMLADPNELSTIEIAALNGKVEPTVETADADFNTLGIQMRAFGDVGVNLQEFRASVLADGNAS
jgi:phage major head subunit gpT-like protein